MDLKLNILSLKQISPDTEKVTLVLNVAIDYVARQGVGIGITLRAESSKTGNHVRGIFGKKEKKEWRQGITHDRFAAENIATSSRAHMLAFCRAMGIARQTLRQDPVKAARTNMIKIASASSTAVDMVRSHLPDGPGLLQDVEPVQDRRMIGAVLAGIKKLEKLGLEVEITHDNSGHMVKATKIAKQKGRKACQSRRKFYAAQKSRTQTHVLEQQAVSGVSNFEPLWRVLLRKKERQSAAET